MADGDDDDGDQGAFRFTDPLTSRDAAKSIKVGPIMWKILEYLQHQPIPRNGQEITDALEMVSITVVPRLAPMRRWELIVDVGTSVNPRSGRMQMAYMITDKGRKLLSKDAV
jgi:hypothetical protein